MLSAAAQKLTNPSGNIVSGTSKSSEMLIHEVTREKTEPDSWREIVDKRIEAKTRRFSKGRLAAASVESENKFAPVAGYFFFPLLQVFDR